MTPMAKLKNISQTATAFGRYLEDKKITYQAAADAIKTIARRDQVTRSYVHMLAVGRATPGLRLALAIEKFTEGLVPPKTWIGE